MTQIINPIVPQYIKEYMKNYYSNTSSKFIYNNQNYETKNYFLAVEPTLEQISNIINNFQNKSPYPQEIFLNQYLLNVSEELDKTTCQITINYYFVLFLIGKISPNDGIYYPNIISNDYLTATYYKICNLELAPEVYIGSPLPIKLTNSQIIDYLPQNIVCTENNVIFPNSTRYIKIKTGGVIFTDSFPQNQPQPYAIAYIKDENTNLISSGGIGLFDINFLTNCANIIGISQSVLYMILSLQ